jgi:hypothetical protein
MSIFPFPFWVVIGILIAGSAWAIQRIKDGSGIPMLVVIVTVAVWYVGDAFYNDYAHSYALIFDPDVLQTAWWEVAWFLVVFLAAAPYVHRRFNARHLDRQSGVLQLARFGVSYPVLQRQLDILFGGCSVAYAILLLVAAIRIKGQTLYFIFPFLGDSDDPWGRARIGSGFDALLSFALYIQMMVTTVFGVLAAVCTNRRTRFLSLIFCFISWPYFVFGRTRNIILAIAIPAMLSWVFLRLRGGVWKKIIVLAALFIVVNGWMAFIIQNRSNMSITDALREKGFNLKEESDVHHQGLNMFEELCWINTFIRNGTYKPNWGARYFAELVNPVPRALWHNKPLIGIDYAIARGQAIRGAGSASGTAAAGVYATISTGVIGQGVVNFGSILGPAAAALIMSFWAALLARQDLHIWELGRLPLYTCGLILTFNLGRDITFITLYPFVFGVAALWWMERGKKQQQAGNKGNSAPRSPFPAPYGGQPVPQPLRKPVQTMLRRRRIVTRPNGRSNGR